MQRILFLFIFAAAVSSLPAQQYIISTVAGRAIVPTPIAAVNANLPPPAGMAFDAPRGNLYFSAGHAVYSIDGGGTLKRVAGTGLPGFTGDGGQAVAATLNSPTGLAADAAGNLYIADTANYCVRKV